MSNKQVENEQVENEQNRSVAADASSPLTAEETLESLLRRLSEGDEQAAMTIVDRYTPHVLRVVRSSLPNSIRGKVDSTDLVNTLLGALLIKRELPAELRDPSQLMGLLTKAAKDRVVDEYRKYTTEARRVDLEEPIQGGGGNSEDYPASPIESDRRLGSRQATPSKILAAKERWQQVLKDLDDRDRQIVVMRSKGLDSQQIADRLGGVSGRTVRRVLGEVVEKLMR